MDVSQKCLVLGQKTLTVRKLLCSEVVCASEDWRCSVGLKTDLYPVVGDWEEGGRQQGKKQNCKRPCVAASHGSLASGDGHYDS